MSDAEPLPEPLPAGEPRRWKLTLAYDGTDFHGWQLQPGLSTVQGELQQALLAVTGEAPLPQGSGRTDAGVHALGQVASFPLRAAIAPSSLLRALNRRLPASIRVLSAGHAPAGFHARHSAIGKTYEYRIFRGEICPPLLARYVHGLSAPLALGPMERAAAAILGEHDFASFAASDPELGRRHAAGGGLPAPADTVRRITRSQWFGAGLGPAPAQPGSEEPLAIPPGTLIYRVSGSGFLHHMVRNLVGTFLEVGRGRVDPDSMAAILAARSRAAAGPTAPARGLFLVEVEYPANL